MMRRWGWLLLALLIGGCAATPAPKLPEPRRYLILDNGLSSDVLICAPKPATTVRNSYACVPIDFVRWLLLHQTKG